MSQAGDIDIIGSNPEIPILFNTNDGSAVPIANTLELLGEVVPAGTNPFRSIGSGNTVTFQVQYSQASPVTSPDLAGIASFDSTSFDVDENGFVTFIGSAFGGLTPDEGGQVTAVDGNINVYGQKAGTIPVMQTHNIDNDFYIENRTWFTPYVVDNSSTIGLQGTFTTIQSAIDQAVADGASSGNPKTIIIRFGNYSGDLILYDGIFLEGLVTPDTSFQSVLVVGNHSTSGSFPIIGFKNIYFINISDTLDTIINNATNLTLYFENCKFQLADAATGAHFKAETVVSYNCIFAQDDWTKTIFVENTGTFKNCDFGQAIITKLLATNGDLTINQSRAIGQIRYLGLLRSSDCIFNARAPLNLPIMQEGSEAGLGILSGHCLNPLVIGGSPAIAVTGTFTVAIVGMSRSANLFGSFNFPVETHAAWVQGNVKPTRQVSSSTTMEPGDNVLLVDTTIANTITLPSITQGMTYTIKDNTGSADLFPITVASSDPIDGQTNYVINNAWGSATFVRYASNWRVIDNYGRDLHVASFIVNTMPGQGNNYTSLVAAYNAAVSGQTVFVMDGDYDVTGLVLKSGVDIVAFQGESANPNVRLFGKMTADFEGTCTISGVRLDTDGDYFLEIIGTQECNINIRSAFLQCSDFDGINFTNTNANSLLTIGVCSGNINTTGITLFRGSGAGEIFISSAIFLNTGLSDEPSTLSSGTLRIKNVIFFFPLETSGTSSLAALLLEINTSSVPIKSLTVGGSGINSIRHGTFNSLTDTCITVNSVLNLQIAEIGSSNAVVIDGPGTINYSGLNFFVNSTITTATQNVLYEGPSKLIGSSNSGLTNSLTVANISNTASSSSLIRALVGGTSAGDSYFQSSITGGNSWSWGLDNSDSDAWALSFGTALGTTNVMRVSTAGEINYPLQPAFAAYVTTTIPNVTGDLTEYTIIFDTLEFDQNGDFNLATGTFTAPVAGKYRFSLTVSITGGTSIGQGNIKIVTTTRSYQFAISLGAGGATTANSTINHIISMNAGNTATFTVTTSDSGGKIDDVMGLTGSVPRTFVSGELIC